MVWNLYFCHVVFWPYSCCPVILYVGLIHIVYDYISDGCSSFTILQHIAIWGNLVIFYMINWIVSALPRSGMYTIMYRLCRQPSYWITMFVSNPLHQSSFFQEFFCHQSFGCIWFCGIPFLFFTNVNPKGPCTVGWSHIHLYHYSFPVFYIGTHCHILTTFYTS